MARGSRRNRTGNLHPFRQAGRLPTLNRGLLTACCCPDVFLELFMTPGIDTVTLSLLQHKRIYFGHQSVGANIIEGIRGLYHSNQLGLNIVESSQPQAYTAPVFGHSRIGRNQEPRSKIDAFAEILNAGLGKKVDMALLKFCYVDVTDGSDVAGLFDYYHNVMTQLTSAYPHTRFIHVTIPITVMPSLLRRIIGGLRRRRNRGAYDNLARADYNRRLIQTYAGRQPIFDLATAESTTDSGQTLRHSLHGREFYTLVPAYSSDGRHLSEIGRRVVAYEFLKCLATVGNEASTPMARTEPTNV